MIGSNSVAAGDPANEGDKLSRRVHLAPGLVKRVLGRIYSAAVCLRVQLATGAARPARRFRLRSTG